MIDIEKVIKMKFNNGFVTFYSDLFQVSAILYGKNERENFDMITRYHLY